MNSFDESFFCSLYTLKQAATVESQFGSIGADYAMENVGCLGNETKLSECPHKKQDTCFR